MKPTSKRTFNYFAAALTLLILLLALHIRGTSGQAAPLAQTAPAACSGERTGGVLDGFGACPDLQVILIIDGSGSMAFNDPDDVRLAGAELVVTRLGEAYLRAVETGQAPPLLQVAAVHFGSEVNHVSAVQTIAPADADAWEGEREQLLADLIPDAVRTPQGATNFINAFNAAAQLVESFEPAADGCPNRRVLLLTDGAPAAPSVLTGEALTEHMDEVESIANSSMTANDFGIYVTAISASGEDYWERTRVRWEGITLDSPNETPRRAELVDSVQEAAARLEALIAPELGLGAFTVESAVFEIPPLLESLGISYFAPDPSATLEVRDPDGEVFTTEAGEAIQLLDIPNPAPGLWTFIPSDAGGEINLIFTYPLLENTSGELQQFTGGQLSFRLVDSAGQPLALADPAALTMTARITPAGQAQFSLPLAFEDGQFQADLLPAWAGAADVVFAADTGGDSGFECPADLTVDPVTVTASPSESVCYTPPAPILVGLQLINARTEEATGIDLPINWEVSSSTQSGSPVEAAVEALDAGSGQYQLSLSPPEAGDLETSLAASVEIEGGAQVFYEDQFQTSTGEAERSVGLELGAPEVQADWLSILLNRWFNSRVRGLEGEQLIGRRLFASQDVRVSGRFLDLDSGAELAGIERFTLELQPIADGPPGEASNEWQPAGDEGSVIVFASPGVGGYTVAASDAGGSVCETVETPSLNLVLINHYWVYLIWLILLLILLLLVIWLRRRGKDGEEPSGEPDYGGPPPPPPMDDEPEDLAGPYLEPVPAEPEEPEEAYVVADPEPPAEAEETYTGGDPEPAEPPEEPDPGPDDEPPAEPEEPSYG